MKKKTVRALGAMGLLAIVAWYHGGPPACPPTELNCLRHAAPTKHAAAAESRRWRDGDPASPSP